MRHGSFQMHTVPHMHIQELSNSSFSGMIAKSHMTNQSDVLDKWTTSHFYALLRTKPFFLLKNFLKFCLFFNHSSLGIITFDSRDLYNITKIISSQYVQLAPTFSHSGHKSASATSRFCSLKQQKPFCFFCVSVCVCRVLLIFCFVALVIGSPSSSWQRKKP